MNIPIWDNNPGPISGSTIFHFYDDDNAFQLEGPMLAKFIASRLGYPIVNVELTSGSFYLALEEAISTYGNEIYQAKIRDNYLSMEGNLTGSSYNNQLITPNLGGLIRIASTYGTEIGSGGFVTWHTGSFPMTAGVQDYDITAILASQGITGSIEVKKLFYEEPPAIVRYFDPYAGTGTGMNSLFESFGFGSMSPGINFMLMPIYFDIMKIQAIEFNDQVRKSAYSFDLVNNQLRIFPIPYQDKTMFFQYIFTDDRNNPITDTRQNLITNIGNVPYNNPIYAQINSIGKQWIREYALAIAKEMLGYVRGKYTTVPIPGDVTTLNSADLITAAKEEKEALLTQLRATLDETSRKAQLEKQAAEADNVQKAMANMPMLIYIM